MPAPFTIRSDERILCSGKTGSGKTYLMRYLTKPLRRLVVLDGKGTLDNWDLVDLDRNSESLLFSDKPVRIRARLPEREEAPEAYWDSILMKCYQAGDVTIYIDELYAVAPPNQKVLPALWTVYTRGREFSVGVWASTQRPVWIPLVALSEAEAYIVFRLTLEEDRKRMAAFIGPTALNVIRDQHGFYFARAEWDNPEYFQKLVTRKAGD